VVLLLRLFLVPLTYPCPWIFPFFSRRATFPASANPVHGLPFRSRIFGPGMSSSVPLLPRRCETISFKASATSFSPPPQKQQAAKRNVFPTRHSKPFLSPAHSSSVMEEGTLSPYAHAGLARDIFSKKSPIPTARRHLIFCARCSRGVLMRFNTSFPLISHERLIAGRLEALSDPPSPPPCGPCSPCFIRS